MKRKSFYAGLGLLVLFIIWTVVLLFVDVEVIGPQGSSVGFALLNKTVHNITGVHMSLYTVTDWLGLVPFCFIMGFGILGLCEWIKRRSLFKVDFSILVLGGFYIIVMAVYAFFEMFVVNYRPVLINGVLEASYPSSTTMLVMCVMPTAIMQFNSRIKNSRFKKFINIFIIAFIAFMVMGRLVSGVHWFSDIIGGALLSSGLVMIYRDIIRWESR
ncbi:MAG: phosphatase PAP2 family protein [Ruminococcaceae bacterium]|nr:phosphatase PAP2 family protein [Oscillospiraceae bacterium]